jgi:formate hydrogenlyase subunit 3/multisubunit Na+/H+ antiporter MnhD subunit
MTPEIDTLLAQLGGLDFNRLLDLGPGHLTLPVVLPLLAAFLVLPLSRVAGPLARLLGPLTLAASAWILVRLWMGLGDAPIAVGIGGFAAPLGIVFYADRLALLFALAVPVLGLLFWPGIGDRGDGERAARRDALTLLLIASSTGLALTGDLFNIFVFYELAAVASYGLAALTGTPRAQVATLRYLLIGSLGSVLALVGITIVYLETGTLNLAHLAELAPQTLQGPLGLGAFVLMLIGFGVKAELFPLNSWVPEVYATAPARVSALLAGLVSKLAVLVLVRLLVLVFHQPETSQILLILGILGMLAAELSAWRAKDFPRMIAFSSAGQLGVVFVAFAIDGELGVMAGLAVALHHLIVKSALFGLSSGWSGSLDGLAGAARRAPIACGLFVLFALSLIGVPPLPGFWTKVLVLIGLAKGGSPLELLALAALLITTALESSYLFRVAVRLFERTDSAPKSPGLWDTGVVAVLGAALLAIAVAIAPTADWLRDLAHQASDRAAYIETVFPQTVARED